MALYEGKFRQDTTEALRKAGLMVSTVEGGGLGGTPGIPDVYYSGTVMDDPQHLPGLAGKYIEGWIELKVMLLSNLTPAAIRGALPIGAKGAGTKALDHFTSQQRTWLAKHSSRGGRCHLYLRIDGDTPDRRWYFLFEGRWAADHLGRDALYTQLEQFCQFGRAYNHRREPDGKTIVRHAYPLPARTP